MDISKARNTDPRYSKLTIGVCPDQGAREYVASFGLGLA